MTDWNQRLASWTGRASDDEFRGCKGGLGPIPRLLLADVRGKEHFVNSFG